MTDFARLVSLACHDLRTPLATVRGFATTLQRTAGLEPPESRYLELIDAASLELTEILDLLGLAARVEGGRQEAAPADVDTTELAQAVADEVGEQCVTVDGTGTVARVDVSLVKPALVGLVRGALRHGALEELRLSVAGASFELSPVAEQLAPILTGDEPKDLGAAVATLLVRSTGGSVELRGETLVVSPALP